MINKIPKMQNDILPPQRFHCTSCNNGFTSSVLRVGSDQPATVRLSVCPLCRTISVIDENLMLIPLTQLQLMELSIRKPDVYKALKESNNCMGNNLN